MGKIVAADDLTLDGVTEDPGPAGEFEHRGWSLPYWNDELAEHQSELVADAVRNLRQQPSRDLLI